MLKVLVIEDNADLCSLVALKLQECNFAVDTAHNGKVALDKYYTNHYDIIITDVMMPKVSGIEVVEKVRETDKNIPILIITAKDTLDDKMKAYNVGTDDYMVKPIVIDELIMRVNALLRRAKIISDRRLTIGGATLDYDNYTIDIDGVVSTLPQKEFLILFKLLSYPNQTFTRVQLMNEFWEYDSDSDDMTVYTHIHRLRDRFEGCKYFDIVTIKNLGYKAIIK